MEKTVINKIKTLLKMEIQLERMTLENGTVIEADAFETGASVFIVTEDGQVPLPIGEYELPGSMKLIVAEDGVISEVKAMEEEAVAEVEVEAEEVTTEVAEEAIVVIEEVETAVIEKVAAVIDAATPEEVTTEDSSIIAAEVIAEVITVIEEVATTEMRSELKANLKKRKAELSAQRKVKPQNHSKIVKASKEVPAAKAIKPNPEKESKKSFKFNSTKFGTTETRVLSKIAKIQK